MTPKPETTEIQTFQERIFGIPKHHPGRPLHISDAPCSSAAGSKTSDSASFTTFGFRDRLGLADRQGPYPACHLTAARALATACLQANIAGWDWCYTFWRGRAPKFGDASEHGLENVGKDPATLEVLHLHLPAARQSEFGLEFVLDGIIAQLLRLNNSPAFA